uniref:Uncharacterized protein n=1 Tax=Panagrolaimus sp. JU765 TaxID=591449 RepID=A0AC34R6R7_9BILA
MEPRLTSLCIFFSVIICLLLQTTMARSIYPSESQLFDSRRFYDSDFAKSSNFRDQQFHQMAKRRLVVRVPFAQTPDHSQLHRLYKTLFHNKEKKFTSLQNFL